MDGFRIDVGKMIAETKIASRYIRLSVVALACLLPSLAPAQTYGPNILSTGSFDNVTPTYVPWAGVDDNGNIHGLEGKQIAVGDDGTIQDYPFAPSVARSEEKTSELQ